MKRTPLKEGWYDTTITQITQEERSWRFVFTVDTGDFAWQSVTNTFRVGSARLDELFRDLLIIPVLEPGDPLYLQQFLGHRAAIKVDRVVDGNFIKNVILQLDIPIGKSGYDVTKGPSEDKFYKNKIGRKLPL